MNSVKNTTSAPKASLILSNSERRCIQTRSPVPLPLSLFILPTLPSLFQVKPFESLSPPTFSINCGTFCPSFLGWGQIAKWNHLACTELHTQMHTASFYLFIYLLSGTHRNVANYCCCRLEMCGGFKAAMLLDPGISSGNKCSDRSRSVNT